MKETRRCRLEAKSAREQNLLIELEELGGLLEYQEVEIKELEGDIQDFYFDLHEPNEDLFEIDNDEWKQIPFKNIYVIP